MSAVKVSIEACMIANLDHHVEGADESTQEKASRWIKSITWLVEKLPRNQSPITMLTYMGNHLTARLLYSGELP